MAETKAEAEGTGESIFKPLPPIHRPGSSRRAGKTKPLSEPRTRTAPASIPATREQKDGMENSLTMLYGFAGLAIEQRGVTFTRPNPDGSGSFQRVWQPSLAGRAMKLGSPAAGQSLSNWISNVPWLSAILGPILGNDAFTTIAKVAGLPVMLHVLQVRPESAPMLQPMVMPMLADLFASIKKLEKESQKAMAEFADMGEDVAREFQDWVGGIFGVAEQVVTEPEPELYPEPEPSETPFPVPEGVSVNGERDQIDAELGR